MGVENLVVSGGEPLMREDLFEMLAYARRKKLNVTLLTNGLLIDERAARLLAELHIRVKISLDGATARRTISFVAKALSRELSVSCQSYVRPAFKGFAYTSRFIERTSATFLHSPTCSRR
jgi:MoaA/NifB/PqqE/SkfB family radical SAM enzyme